MELLVEIDFDSGTRRYSRLGLRTPDAFYHGRVTAFGGIAREISLLPEEYRASSVSVTLSNVAGEFTTLRSNEPWRNRPFRILVVDPDAGFGTLYTAFEGRIESWNITKEACTIQAVDWIQSRLQRPLQGAIDVGTYANLPDETPRALIPIVIGEVDSPTGAVPAYLVDPNVGVTGWRYVMAQGRVPAPTEVYAFGSLVDSGDYAIAYAAGPGGGDYTYIDFTADPRIGGDGSEPHVAWNGEGVTDDETETGSAVTNGAQQLATLLRLQGFAADDLDLNTITDAAAELSALSIVGAFVAADRQLTVGDAVTQFAENYNLQIFSTRTGKVGVSAPPTSVDNQNVPVVTALKDVVRDTFSAAGTNQVASTVIAPYKRNYFSGDLEALHSETNDRQVKDLGEDVVLRREFPFIKDATSINAVVEVRMFYLREQRQLVRVLTPPHWYEDIDIGDTIKLEHFAGIGVADEITETHRTEDLAALYRIDEGSGDDLLDTSGNANDGELGSATGADANDPDWVDEGLDFNTDNDRVRLPFLLDPAASDFTVFVVFQVNSGADLRALVSQASGAGQGRIWMYLDATDRLNSGIGGAASQHSSVLTVGDWYVATVRKFGGTVSIFIEGGDKEDFTRTAEAADGDMFLGVGIAGAGNDAGRMALVAIYDDALSDAVINENTLALKEIVNHKSAPIGFYRVLGSKLVSAGRMLAADLSLVDLAQEPLLTLFVAQIPESLAFIDGKSTVTSRAVLAMLADGSAAGTSAVAASASQRWVTNGLQHLWLFDDGSGQQLTDYVGSLHGELGSSSGADASDPAWVSEGLDFDGADDYVTFGHIQNPASGDWTLLIVFRSEANARTIFATTSGGATRSDWLAHTSADVLESALPTGDVIDNAASITANTWYMVYVRRNASANKLDIRLRRTGSLFGVEETTGVDNVPDPSTSILGMTSFNFPDTSFGNFDGQMAFMAHWNRRLSDTEMTQMFDGVKDYLSEDRGISL